MMNKLKVNTAIYFSLVLGIILNFSIWFGDRIAIKNGESICSRFFQSCQDYLFLTGLPLSWHSRLFHFFIFCFIIVSVYAFLQQKERLAKLLLIFPLVAEGSLGFIFFEQSSIPFIYYHFFPCLIFIFSRDFKNDLKYIVVLLYTLSGWVKLDEGWLAGGYFETLKLGAPLIPHHLITPVSILVTIMELTSCVLILNHGTLKKIFFYFFCFFHIYSFIIVGYQYPLLCLPLLFFSFQDDTEAESPSKLLVITAVILVTFNLSPHLIDPEYKLTGQGDSLALNMFDGNRQSFSKMIIHKKNGHKEELSHNTYHSYDRVKPYHYWFRGKSLCHGDVDRISWKLDVSINGRPFQRIVNVPNLCSLEFKPFQRNSWIHLDEAQIQLPFPNSYDRGGLEMRSAGDHIDLSKNTYFKWIMVNKVYIRWTGILISLGLLIAAATTLRKYFDIGKIKKIFK